MAEKEFSVFPEFLFGGEMIGHGRTGFA